MRRLLLFLVALVLVLAALGGAYLVGYDKASRALATTEQGERESEFQRSMAGVVLEGNFTVEGSDADGARTERYTIESVEKVAGDYWVFRARVQFGETDVTLPVPVRLVWAGDTPVVTLTDAQLPGLGTFSARVVFYRDRYVGLWSSPQRGGFQFGRVLRGRTDLKD